MTAVHIANVLMTAAGAADQATGVVGFVTATINGLVIDGLTVRRGLAGELWIGFPRRTDTYGQVHSIVRPADDGIRREITRQVLAALGLDGAASDAHHRQGSSAP